MVQTMDKTVSYLRNTQVFVLGHMTSSASWWRHQPVYIYTLNVLSEFDQIKAKLCKVMANWIFPSSGPKRYCNGPLTGRPYSFLAYSHFPQALNCSKSSCLTCRQCMAKKKCECYLFPHKTRKNFNTYKVCAFYRIRIRSIRFVKVDFEVRTNFEDIYSYFNIRCQIKASSLRDKTEW